VKILGLDVSTKSTGWFITKRSCGVIAPPKEPPFAERLALFRVEIEYLVLKYKPDVVVIEDAYYRPGFGNIHTLKTLVKFAGVAIEVCGTHKVPVEIITATQARKYCCGPEKLDKKGVFDYFVRKYKLNEWTFEKDNDKTDAMALVWGYREIQKAQAKEKSSTKEGNKKKARN